MKKLRILILLVISLTVVSSDPLPQSADEITAENLMRAAEHEVQKHWVNLKSGWFSKGSRNPHHLVDDSEKQFRHFNLALAKNLSVLAYNDFRSEGLKRQVKRLSMLQIAGLDEEDFARAQELLNASKHFSTDKIVCSYDDCNDQFAYLPWVQSIMTKSRHVEEIKYYWKEWRNTISEKARKNVLEYIDLYRKAAALNGHVTPSKTWYVYYEDSDFLKELTTAIEELKPLYKEFHAYLRHVFRNFYGKQNIAEEGMIPDHFMEQIIQQAWKSSSVFKPPYPDHPLPNVNEKIEKKAIAPLMALDIADKFFDSIGIPNLPLSFWREYAKNWTEENAPPDCKAELSFFKPHAAINLCPKVDYKKFLQMNTYIAELQYNVHRSSMPYGLSAEAFPGLGAAIGEAFVIAASSTAYLVKHDLMDDTGIKLSSMNRLFRMGVHTIFTLSRYFINEKFWVEALDHKVAPEHLNCLYWSLQGQYMGVSPPETRTEKNFDPDYKFYLNLVDNASTTKIISELLGYQIYKALCIKSGKYSTTHPSPSTPLHQCDFSGSHEAGQPVSQAMLLGSSKPWRDVVETLTGERTINAKAMLEYYQPLFEWLKEQNKKHGVHVGWEGDYDDSCVD